MIITISMENKRKRPKKTYVLNYFIGFNTSNLSFVCVTLVKLESKRKKRLEIPIMIIQTAWATVLATDRQSTSVRVLFCHLWLTVVDLLDAQFVVLNGMIAGESNI